MADHLLVIFGGNGDLTARKLIPSLYKLFCLNRLDPSLKILAVSRSEYSNLNFREAISKRVEKLSDISTTTVQWSNFIEKIFYQPLDVHSLEDFSKFRSKLEELAGGSSFNAYYYLATSPSLYAVIVRHLAESKLVRSPEDQLVSNLIVEKPIGRDLSSAQKLNEEFSLHFAESQIYRIDHYLGKETVQNILLFRFANAIFEGIWNRNFIEHIQINVSETIGVEGRESYYDSSGALRDMLQNHVMQLLGLLCLEPPTSLTCAESIHNEKVKVLQSVRPFGSSSLKNDLVRGQYTSGEIDGEEITAYQDLPEVASGSNTETYIACKLEIDNWRWAGVPILLRTGKCLAERRSDIQIVFKQAPASVLNSIENSSTKGNILSICIQPEESIKLSFNTRPPGLNMQVKSVLMDFDYVESFHHEGFEAYEKLLLDIFKGDQTLFIRKDEVEVSWELFTPVLEAWDKGEDCSPLELYPAGTWGPKAAEKLTRGLSLSWKNF